MASHQPVQVTCKAEVFETKACGKRQVGTGMCSIYSGCSCSRRVFYVSVIYCLVVAVKNPFLSLQYYHVDCVGDGNCNPKYFISVYTTCVPSHNRKSVDYSARIFLVCAAQHVV